MKDIRLLKETYGRFNSRVNRERLLSNTENLWSMEIGQTFDCYHRSAQLAEKLLHSTGCLNVERIAIPADGKTVYQDKTMPIGWNATKGRLEVIKSPIPFEDPVIADFERHPFHLVKGSVATPEEGIVARVLSEEDVRNGVDARGALILFNENKRPNFRIYRHTGAIGVISDNLTGRHVTPDAIQWANACTASYSWHTVAEDYPYIGFIINPRTGDRLREALQQGEVNVRVFSDGQRREDKIEVVTGVIPGEDEREIWLLAHLYEPLANDNSSGVACALEIAHVLQSFYADQTLRRPRFTLRLVFAMEVYGFAAYAEMCGGRLRDRVMCAVNLDALPILPSDYSVVIGLSQSGCPSSSDYLFEELLTSGVVDNLEVVSVQSEGLYADDRLLGDSTIGVPTLWFTRPDRSLWLAKAGGNSGNPLATRGLYLWHNSEQTMDCIAPDVFHNVVALYGTWIVAMLAADIDDIHERLQRSAQISIDRLNQEFVLIHEKLTNNKVNVREQLPLDWLKFRWEIETNRIRDYIRFGADCDRVEQIVHNINETFRKLEEKLSILIRDTGLNADKFQEEIWNQASRIIIWRKTRGLPRDFAAIPYEERVSREFNYDRLMHIVLVHADGQRSLAELLLRAQWESRSFCTAEQITGYVHFLQWIAMYGYIGLKENFLDETRK